MKGTRQQEEVKRWFIKNLREIREALGDESSQKLVFFLESKGILKNTRKVGRPDAPNQLDFIPQGQITQNILVNTIINHRMNKAYDMAKMYAIISKLGFIAPDTPLKTVYNALISLGRFPFSEDEKSVCTYKAFTVACGKAKASKADCDLFIKNLEETDIWITIHEDEERQPYDNIGYEIDDELYTPEEVNEYLQFLRSDLGLAD